MSDGKKIANVDDLIDRVNELGILRFWTEDSLSAWTLSAVDFNRLWTIREEAVNSKKLVYGKFVQKKSTFVSLEAFPYLVSLRRDGYDFDSLSDEGKAPGRESLVMNAVGNDAVPSYKLGKDSGIKGFDAVVTSLQNKTYLCLQFKKSYMGTALLCRPEDVFREEFVRSAYSLSVKECRENLLRLCPGLKAFDEKELDKLLSPAV